MLKKLSQEQVLKKSMKLIVETYNDAMDKGDTKEKKCGRFITAMASKLGFDLTTVSSESTAFGNKMNTAFYSMYCFYSGKKVPDAEKENPRIARDNTSTEVTKSRLINVANGICIVLGTGINIAQGMLVIIPAPFTPSTDYKQSFAYSGIEKQVFESRGGIADKFYETKRNAFAGIVKAETFETAMIVITNIYNIQAVNASIDKTEKRERFLNTMASVLGFDLTTVSPESIAFKAQVRKAFDAMHVYYDGKEIPAAEIGNPRIAQDKVHSEAFKALLLVVVKIILAIPTLGATFWNEKLSDKLTSSGAARKSFADVIITEQAAPTTAKQI